MKTLRCPICDREMSGVGPEQWPDLPFCSARCKLIDLGRWLGEKYSVPAEEADEGLPSAGEESAS
jgi:endogenous inhibitor of DNA gyrase (YacG/DUF329 family)